MEFELVFYQAPGQLLFVEDGDQVPLEIEPSGSLMWFASIWGSDIDADSPLVDVTVMEIETGAEIHRHVRAPLALEEQGNGVGPTDIDPTYFLKFPGCHTGDVYIAPPPYLVTVTAEWADGAHGSASVRVEPTCALSSDPDYCLEQCGDDT